MTTRIPEPLFYHPQLDVEGDALLTGAEARHAAAQRLRPGDAAAVFDGHGRVARGRVASIARDTVRIDVAQRLELDPPRPEVHLYSAVPKGDRQAVLLDMATQLGVNRFVPLAWARSVVEPGARAHERWRRICVEACKQSRRVHVPEIGPVTALEQALAQARTSSARLLFAHPAADARPVLALDHPCAARYALFVGPEGGATDAEVEQLRAAGTTVVSLGDSILRVETAAVALLALVRAAAGESST